MKDYFDAIADDRIEDLIAIFQSFVFPDGVDKPPSPRAADYVETGEWNSATLVRLYSFTESCCGGRIGRDEPVKVCCVHKSSCKIAYHKDSLVSPT